MWTWRLEDQFWLEGQREGVLHRGWMETLRLRLNIEGSSKAVNPGHKRKSNSLSHRPDNWRGGHFTRSGFGPLALMTLMTMNSVVLLFIDHRKAGVAPVPGNKSSLADKRTDILERSQDQRLTRPSQRNGGLEVRTEIKNGARHDSNHLLLRPGGPRRSRDLAVRITTKPPQTWDQPGLPRQAWPFNSAGVRAGRRSTSVLLKGHRGFNSTSYLKIHHGRNM